MTPEKLAIKAAYRQAVKLAGGGRAVEAATGISDAQISRYCSPNDDAMPSLMACELVQREIGDPLILREWARIWGRDLTTPDGDTDAHDDLDEAGDQMVLDLAAVIEAKQEAKRSNYSPNSLNRLGTALRNAAHNIGRKIDVVSRIQAGSRKVVQIVRHHRSVGE
jgi:hypothetical protein